ncbi:ankyrin repeat domain-containing protein [Chryseobacterium sp. MEBOG06]|uniref:ankyrin repeat domain-containing protein n=1 Tax=Chryseobacterium sp. MEBOG06 TaxID=2879938 RepID=UPI001F3AC823|nr:ankyrin repeat domain-containing protein [Chryseobacterium sp. MEBOG06]UKB82731.1 ankyrin repeat domain-containing protein [Chryseobacterium sp. MEBOG06]
MKKEVNSNNVNQLKNEERQNLLHESISSGSYDVLKYLLSININVNAQDNEGMTPLHYCGLYRSQTATRQLLENRSIEINKKDDYGNNPLWTAVFNARGNYDVVKLLKEHGADQNSKNNKNMSPLDFCKEIEDKNMETILLL